MKAVRVLAKGRVQGVGFRQSTQVQARALSLSGWVRNLPDGRVESLIQGEAHVVDELLAWMRRGGPPAARVESLDVIETQADPDCKGFGVMA